MKFACFVIFCTYSPVQMKMILMRNDDRDEVGVRCDACCKGGCWSMKATPAPVRACTTCTRTHANEPHIDRAYEKTCHPCPRARPEKPPMHSGKSLGFSWIGCVKESRSHVRMDALKFSAFTMILASIEIVFSMNIWSIEFYHVT